MIDRLPDCVLRQILELACQEIVRDCREVDIHGVPQFGCNLPRFAWLAMVNKTVHALMIAAVRVEGRLIRTKLLDMQEDNFRHLLLVRDPLPRVQREPEHENPAYRISELRAWCACGPVWLSPRIPDLCNYILRFQRSFKATLFFKLFYHLPFSMLFNDIRLRKGSGLKKHIISEMESKITDPLVPDEPRSWEFVNGPILNFTVGNYSTALPTDDCEAGKHYWFCVALKTLYIGEALTQGTIEDNDEEHPNLWLWYLRSSEGKLIRFLVLDYMTEAIYDSAAGKLYMKKDWDRRDLPKRAKLMH